MHAYLVKNAAGDVIRSGQVSQPEQAECQALYPGERVELLLDAELLDSLDLGRREAVAVTPAMVNAEQARRLRYTDGYVTRAADPSDGRPVPEWVSAQRKAIRRAARRLEALDPIPPDYRADAYWGDTEQK